jgi:hydrogenase expression/formation protein HypD
MHAILGSPSNRVQGFLAAGHVNAVMGYWEYPPDCRAVRRTHRRHRFRAAGHRPGHPGDGQAAGSGPAEAENAYQRAVTFEGNPAQKVINQVFEVRDRQWRGIGTIPASGWGLRPEYAAFDAEQRFDVSNRSTPRSRPSALPGRSSRG